MTAQIVVAVVLTALISFAALSSVAGIGKPRKPLTPAVANGAIVINVLFLVAVWWLALS